MEMQTNAKVGVMIPTYNRPDMARHCVLQMLAQTRRPDVICVHENGLPDSYRWCVEDLDFPVDWLHTPRTIAQHEYYLTPLRHLLDAGCTHFFWVDHDDIYLRHHVETSLNELAAGYDLRISAHCGLLVIRPGFGQKPYAYVDHARFEVHAPKGMSASMAFNRTFAQALLEHLPMHPEYGHSDEMIANVLMPAFRCYRSSVKSTVYVSHAGSVSSRHWTEIDDVSSRIGRFETPSAQA